MFALQDQANRRAGAGGLTRRHVRVLRRRLRQAAVGAACAAAVALPLQFLGAATAQAAPVTFIPLTLVNGWTNSIYSTSDAAVADISGIIYFKGAMATSGTNPVAFTLPVGFRPATNVYVPLDLCGAGNGRLFINPGGVATVQVDGNFGSAQCFTSLDGAWFARSARFFTRLMLAHGWVNSPYGTSRAAARKISGVIYLKGAIRSGTNRAAFTLPRGFRPATDVWVPVDMCSGANGRLIIRPNGVVTVQAEGAFSAARCFTSLDGVSFAPSPRSYTRLALTNGWARVGLGSRAAVRIIAGIVHFKGAIDDGTDLVAFTLPPGLRPATSVFIKVDLCGASNGRLYIQPSGAVKVQAEGPYSDAQCFTSLDGASFAR